MIILPLSAQLEPNQAGAKAANLARAMQAGLWVPESFVLLRPALAGFLDAGQLRPTVRAALAALTAAAPDGPAGPQDFSSQEAALQLELQAVPIPAKIRAEVDPVVRKMLSHAPCGLAVRSSAVSEDLPQASFAGVYATVLGVTDLEGFWQAVRAVWSSAWSAQAAAYLRRMNPGAAGQLAEDGMAVLIQPLLAAECSGVIFSADPLSGNPWRFVLNAVPGLAAAMVDGAAPADRFVLDWESAAILERRVVSKPSMTTFAAGAVRRLPLPAGMQNVPSLSDEQARAVGALALTADRLFDRRMDLEWAFAGGRLFLLQARPLTALPAFFPHELSPAEAALTWTPYLNTFAPVNPRERLIAPFHRETWLLEQWSRFQTPEDYFPRREGQERDFNGYRYSTPWRWYGKPTDWSAIETWLDASEAGLRRTWQDQLARAHRENGLADARAAQLAALKDPLELAAAWLRLALHFRREENIMQAAVWHAPQWLIFTCEELLGRFLKECLPERTTAELLSNLLQGLSCHSSELTAAARDLGQAVTEEPVRAAFRDLPLSRVIPYLYENLAGSAFFTDLQTLCRDYGLVMPERDGSKNPYAQDLDGVLLAIRGGVLGEGLDPRTVQAQAAARRAEYEAEVEARLGSPEQAARFRKLLGWAQFWTPALDNRKWHTSVNARLGEIYRETQTALVRAGLIDSPDTFFLLTTQDWEDFCARPDPAALRTVVQARRRAYERNRRLEPPAYLGTAPAQAEAQAKGQAEAEARASALPAEAGRVYTGEGIAAGTARGTAYLADDLESMAYLDGLTGEHILICTRDSFNAQWRRDWYALFMVVRGLVMVGGAQLHHAAQMARECGVPFINIAAGALTDLPDGCQVEIDGQAGTLKIL